MGAISAERRREVGAMKDSFDSVVGGGKQAPGANFSGASGVDQSSILNQIIGKSVTELDSQDSIYTFIATRQFRAHM